jgi:hypothetical protein
MPANIAHILIANKAYDEIKNDSTMAEISEQILSKNNHFYLGSLGPDLPSYKTSKLIEAALNQLLVRPFVSDTNPQEEDASFFLHSTRPNLFPFYLLETNLSYAEIKDDKSDKKEFNLASFVFTLGYVSHIAADQIIHRLVREIVGPYYRSLEISQKHSECEVHQDIFLFYELFPNRTFSKSVQKELVNINKFGFEYDQFCNMLSLSISKAGYKKINKDDIEGWFNGIKITFDLMDNIGPYVSALKNYDQQKNNMKEFPLYKKYFRDESKKFDYMTYFNKAVQLSVKYMKEIIRIWQNPDFSYNNFVQYQKIIQPEDLTSPFRSNLLDG